MSALLPLLPLLWQGALMTLQVTLLAAALAALLALLAATARQTPWAPLRALGAAYVGLFRGTSLLVQLFWLFYVLPLPPFGLQLAPLTVGVLGLGLNGGAYGAELLRGALAAVPRGQHEAAIALNLAPLQRWWRIVLPQALRHALPPATTLLIELLKGSALVSLIGLADLSMRGNQLAEATFDTAPAYGLVLLGYFIMAQAIHLLMRLAERRLAQGAGMTPAWFDWGYAWRIIPELLRAGVAALWITLLAFALALAGGLLLALLRRAAPRWLAWPAAALVELVRSTPLLIQLMLLYYVLPDYGVTLSAALAGVLGLGLHYACYLSEVYRAGLDGVARGQWEAATALNLPRRHTWLRVVLPQALPPLVPALGNYLIAMLKDTPVLSAITVVELMLRAKNLGAHSFRYIEPITLAGLFFLLVSMALAWLLRRLEARLRTH